MKQSEQVLEWMAEGRVEGRAEGRVEGQVNALLKMLAARLSVRVPADLAELIRTTATEEKLDRWLEAAARTASLDDFRLVVEQNGV